MPRRPTADALNPRKRPEQPRSAATVAAIVEAAARILETEGFEGYTTNQVAARAGVSIGSLYQYFPNRDAITRALIERENEALLADVEKVAGDAEGRTGLKHLLAAAIRHQFRRPALARLLDLEESRLPLADDLRRVGERAAATLRRCLSATHPGEAPDDAAVGDIMAMVRGMVDGAGQRGETDAAALQARVERAVFGYLEWDGKISSAPVRPN